ncbi:MAG: SH3 domain-containing protein [Acutalibacteraceae bacterium]|nr:SH3 domain-containing protein [Acutalibacteraceae bacterium]
MKKTAEGLALYAKKQVGKPYWYGTFGQRSSLELLTQKKKQYPKYYTAADFKNQLGVKVHDCIGLIKGYIWCKDADDYNPKYSSNGCPDVNEEMMYNEAKVKGDISTMPDTPGICVLKQGHIGVYIGGGEVIEARGHNYGVVKTKLKDRGWTKWCECPYIAYNKSESKTDYVKVKTNGSVLNCRKKPKLVSKILTTFPNGKKLVLIEKTTKKWYKVSDGKTTGYAYAKWLKEV